MGPRRLPPLLTLLLLLALLPAAGCRSAGNVRAVAAGPNDLFVSPDGDDLWSGRLASPNLLRTDGPVATPARARDLARAGGGGGGATVYLRGGRYQLDGPLAFTAADSNTTYAAYPGETPVLTTARPVTGWRTTTVNGRPAWVAAAPEPDFRQLFVDGRRAPRPRLPKVVGDGGDSFYRMTDAANVGRTAEGRPVPETFKGGDWFVPEPGHVRGDWRNLPDVDVVVPHFWIEERMPVESVDGQTGRVTSSRRSQMGLADDWTQRWARYYADNVFEALTEPGEFYLDRAEQRVYYLPLPGQRRDKVRAEAARGEQVLVVRGNPERGSLVENLAFRGLTFRGTDWRHPAESAEPSTNPAEKPSAGMAQSAYTLRAAVEFTGARDCRLEDCTVENVGQYGVELGEGSRDNRLVGNRIRDCGAGGIKIVGADHGKPAALASTGNRVTDNRVEEIGRVFHSGAGVLLRHASDTVIAHNDVSGGYQMGVAVGWVWGYGPNPSHHNRVEFNHIHHFGQRWLSDVGAVYTLGVQPGTVVRNNHIHDIRAATYGGWGIYTDEGSSEIVIEDNVVHDVSHHCFHQHYGRDNVVRNNLLMNAGVAVVEISRPEEHNSVTIERNAMVARGTPIYGPAIGAGGRRFVSNRNAVWDAGGDGTIRATPGLTWDEWKASGQDTRSIVKSPKVTEIHHGPIAVDAAAIDFRPIDLSEVGPRAPDERD